jgi:hypothetical protein
MKGILLLHWSGFDQSKVHDVRYQRRHTVVAKATRVDSRRNERAAKSVLAQSLVMVRM